MTRLVASVLAGFLAALPLQAADPWIHHTVEDTPGLTGNEIQFLAPSKAGGIWVGTLGGAARVHEQAFTPLKNDKGAPLQRQVWWILEGSDRMWVGHEQGAIEIRDGKQRDTLPGFTVAPVIEIAPAVFWAIGKNAGSDTSTLFEFRDNDWKPVEAVAKRRLTNLYATKNGRLWITLHGNGVLEVDPAAGVDKAVHHLEGLNVTAVTQDSRGVIWCGLWANGLASWDGTAWKRELGKLKASAILAIVEDRKPELWVATSANGLWHRPATKTEWINEFADEGGISLLVATADGRVWVSSQSSGGLRCWNGETWTVSLESPLPIRTLVETADGTLWAGGVLDGLYVLKQRP